MDPRARQAMPWLIYGSGTDLAADVAEIVWRRGEHLALLVDNLPERTAAAWAGVPTIGPDGLDDTSRAFNAAVAQTTPGIRYLLAGEARALGLASFPALVDPSAVVARTAQLGDGIVVGAGAVVAALSRIGAFVMVNRSASVGHHADIGDYASLGPGCVLAGRVTIGRGAFVGAGAVCAPQVTVGRNATVGAGAVVIADVPEGAVAVGNPARVIREGQAGYQGYAVP
jgi:sugar O-acyltransferase (sialic acid O-acetyltransferase NeuD family)